MRWDVFCAVVGCVNLVVWMTVAHLMGRRLDLAHKRIDEAEAQTERVRRAVETVAENHLGHVIRLHAAPAKRELEAAELRLSALRSGSPARSEKP